MGFLRRILPVRPLCETLELRMLTGDGKADVGLSEIDFYDAGLGVHIIVFFYQVFRVFSAESSSKDRVSAPELILSDPAALLSRTLRYDARKRPPPGGARS